MQIMYLQTSILNKHLASLMDGLTAKVFRTYNASKTLQEQLGLLTNCKWLIQALNNKDQYPSFLMSH